jgi:hypothetical protein
LVKRIALYGIRVGFWVLGLKFNAHTHLGFRYDNRMAWCAENYMK